MFFVSVHTQIFYMHYRRLGKTDLKISEISLGAMSFPNEIAAIKKIVDKAKENGINYIDTADLYDKGLNESNIGKAIEGNRHDWIIATKVGNKFSSEKEGWEWAPSKKYILSAVEASLKRLDTDYIDLYQLHGGTLEDPFDEIVEAFELLQQQGKIKHYGISSIRPNVIRKYVAESNIVSVMTQYSLLDRRPETSVLPLLKENQISVMARGSLAKGLLVSKPAQQYLSYTAAAVQTLQDFIHQLSNGSKVESSIALDFVLRQDAITSAVVGVSKLSQLDELLAFQDSAKLTDDEYKELTSILPIHIYTEHI